VRGHAQLNAAGVAPPPIPASPAVHGATRTPPATGHTSRHPPPPHGAALKPRQQEGDAGAVGAVGAATSSSGGGGDGGGGGGGRSSTGRPQYDLRTSLPDTLSVQRAIAAAPQVTDEHRRAFLQDGFVRLRGVIPQPALDDAVGAINAWMGRGGVSAVEAAKFQDGTSVGLSVCHTTQGPRRG